MRVRGPGGVLYGLDLLDSSLSKIPEVESNGTVFAAVHKPGDNFSVRVFWCLEGGGGKEPPALPMIIDCFLDGKSVGYSKKFQAGGNHSARFDGFRIDGDWRKVTSFVFAAPQQTAEAQDGGHGRSGELGTVKVTFIPAETFECPGQAQCQRCRKYAGLDKHSVKGGSAPAPSMQQLPDGKKFYMAPSLGASTGKTIYRVVQPRKEHFRHTAGAAKITLILRYETVSILSLRKILDPKIPEHVEIIRRASEPAPSASKPPQKVKREAAPLSQTLLSSQTSQNRFSQASQNPFSQASEAGMSTQGDDVKPDSQKLDSIFEDGSAFGSQSGRFEEEDVKPRKRRRPDAPVYIDLGDD